MEPIQRPRFTKEQLIKKLLELSSLIGRTPKYHDLKGASRPLGFPGPSSYEKYFGSWSKALTASGLIPSKRGNSNGRKPFEDDVLLSKLQELFVSLGRTPSRDEIKLLSKQRKFPSAAAYEKHFGSWTKALMRANIPVIKGGVKKGSPEAMAWGKRMATIKRTRFPKNPYSNVRLRFEVLMRDNFTCQYCGRTPHDGAKLVVDHILAVANGGATDKDNLTTSCFECNSGKSCLLLNGQQKMATERLGSQ